jgi:glycine/D-amino acid oxidase-like deaminating enzyme
MGVAGEGVGIVGGGLAGALLALALAERGVAVQLLDGGGPSATAFSYGVIPGFPLDPSPLARLAAAAGSRWRELQRRHGDLGWRPRRRWPLPLSQVDTARLAHRLEAVLASAGVRQRRARVASVVPIGERWCLSLAEGETLELGQVVLAAGAGCLALRPELAPVLGGSWAGVLALPPPAGGGAYPLRLPTRFQRLAVEARAAALAQPEWVVDAGLVPWGDGGLLGQLSWFAPGAAAATGPPPPQAEAWLRGALAGAPPPLGALAAGPGQYQQLPVAFCPDGLPLVGPLAPGLWVFSGFRGAFAQVPVLAPLLAAALGGREPEAQAAEAALRRLGLGRSLRGRS